MCQSTSYSLPIAAYPNSLPDYNSAIFPYLYAAFMHIIIMIINSIYLIFFTVSKKNYLTENLNPTNINSGLVFCAKKLLFI